jgi:hypothetical protein
MKTIRVGEIVVQTCRSRNTIITTTCLPNNLIWQCLYKNVREYRRGNHKWTIQINWQHWVHEAQDEDKQNKNTTQYLTYRLFIKSI